MSSTNKERSERVARAIEDISAGKMVILVDDEDRENEGDLTIAADLVTPETINFMAKLRSRAHLSARLHRGKCRSRSSCRFMSSRKGAAPLGTAFTVSIEARARHYHRYFSAPIARTPSWSRWRRKPRPEDLDARRAMSFRCAPSAAACSMRTGQTEALRSIWRGWPACTPAGVHLRDHERRRLDGADA